MMTEQITEIPEKPIQPEIVPEIPAQLPKNSNLPKIVLLVVLGLLVAGGLVYAGMNLGKKQITPSKIIAEPALKPASPTADWKTYNNSNFSFKYPSNWQFNELNWEITSVSPQIILTIVPDKDTMMNECMGLDETNTVNNLMVKKFTRINTGEMCGGGDPTLRESWITKPGGEGYGPGIIFGYKSTQEAEKIFDQILSTFKFFPSPTLFTPPSSVNLLPITGWVLASNNNFSLKYPSNIYDPIVKENYIQLKPKGNTDNDFSKSPDFLLVDNYNGGSIRDWYLNHYSYYASEILFTEKTLGAIKVLEVSKKGETTYIQDILVSSNNKLVDVLVQGADLTEVETIISTLKFSD